MRRTARKAPPLGLALDPTQPDPLHKQIGEQLRRAILDGRLAAGTRLPSSRLMADELNCARGTVLAAVEQLIAEGYLVARAGSGMSVAANLPDEMLTRPSVPGTSSGSGKAAAALSRRGEALLIHEPAPQAPFADSAIAFPLGQPDRNAFPFPLWAKLLEQEWRNPAWEVAGAPHPFGHAGLRSAIADYLGMARGFRCDPRAVVVTSGVRQSLAVITRIVLDPGDDVWIEEPCFRGTREALGWADARAVGIPIDAFGFNIEVALARSPSARLAVVAPSHHFPLGTVLSLQRRLALLSWAERSGGWIVEDDFDGEYRYAGRPLAPLRALDRSDRVAYLGSFSKLLFPALRLSFMILPEALVVPAEKIMAGMPDRPSLLGQGALGRFIADGHLGTHLRRTRLLYADRQDAVINAARRHLAGVLDIEPDAGGMHLIARPAPDIAASFDDRRAVTAAAAKGISIAALSDCYSGNDKAQGLILGYAGTPDEAIDPAIRSLADALCGLHAPGHLGGDRVGSK